MCIFPLSFDCRTVRVHVGCLSLRLSDVGSIFIYAYTQHLIIPFALVSKREERERERYEYYDENITTVTAAATTRAVASIQFEKASLSSS